MPECFDFHEWDREYSIEPIFFLRVKNFTEREQNEIDFLEQFKTIFLKKNKIGCANLIYFFHLYLLKISFLIVPF